MKRPVIVFSALSILLGALAGLIARPLLRPLLISSDSGLSGSTREWLERHEIRTTLDLDGLRLSAPNGPQRGAFRDVGSGLLAFRKSEFHGISTATDLASDVHQVRGQSDGDEFWRLVKEFDLDLPVSAPPATSHPATSPELDPTAETENPSRSLGGYQYDWAIEPGLPSNPPPRSVHLPQVELKDPIHTSLESPPEFLASGPAFVVYRILARDGQGNRFSFEATLEPGRLTVDTPALKAR